MESWRKVWRVGVAPLLSTLALEALEKALETDDFHLIKGCTTSPPPLECVRDWPVEGGCAFAFCGWKREGLNTIGEVEEFFARLCYEVDLRLNEPAGCRWFLNWFDEVPREKVFAALLEEVRLELGQRLEAELKHEMPFTAAR